MNERHREREIEREMEREWKTEGINLCYTGSDGGDTQRDNEGMKEFTLF